MTMIKMAGDNDGDDDDEEEDVVDGINGDDDDDDDDDDYYYRLYLFIKALFLEFRYSLPLVYPSAVPARVVLYLH